MGQVMAVTNRPRLFGHVLQQIYHEADLAAKLVKRDDLDLPLIAAK